MRTDILDRKAEILEWIANNDSKASIAARLRCKIDTFESYMRKMGIVYKGNMSLKGKQRYNQRVSVHTHLVKGSSLGSHKLKLKLFRDGVKEKKCECCGIEEWRGLPAPLELDHIDGDHYNNELSNLRILCPNCHAQTETHSGKNRSKKNIAEKLSDK
jgi:Zn finger protein HypA/HybF involved in hydrogenase expression